MLESRLTHRLVTLFSVLALGVAASACSGSDTDGDGTGEVPTADSSGGGGGSGLPGTDAGSGGGDKDGGSGPVVCVPACEAKMCGDDGCGGICGECEVGTLCDSDGGCVAEAACTDTCDDKTCGTVCGVSCGTCPDGDVCADFACTAGPACTPDCDATACGDDGCGGTCDTCPEGQLCDADGVCQSVTNCQPTCVEGACGDDGCGGSCGTCEAGYTCSDAGECVMDACVPACEAQECGDDGCGGSCGTCAVDETCSVDGLCEAGTCVPDCDGKDCGDDGCGNQCGACGANESCNDAGQCAAVTADPCDPNPCVLPPETSCEDGALTLYDDEGTCTPVGDTYSCEYAYDLEDCGENEICQGGECVEAPEPGEFSDDVSVLNEVVLAEANEPSTCCFDYDGDGQPDNGLVDLLSTLSSFLSDVDIDGSLADAIDSGDVVVLLEALGLDALDNDDQIGVNGYVGYYDEDGAILIQPSSLNEDGTPVVYFDDGQVSGNIASIGPSDFQASLPFAGTMLNLAVKDARGQAEISAADDGAYVDMDDGRLGGLLSFADLVDTINSVAQDCECLDLNGGNLLDLTDEDSISCSDAFDDANVNCSDADGSICTGLAGIADQKFLVCAIGVGLIGPDIDTDFNGKSDHFSVGIRFTGSASQIDGVGDDQSPSGCSDCAGGGNPLSNAVFLALFAMAFAFVTRRRRA